MIGILFIYWIWKAFSNLAIKYNKNKWKYFFIGLLSYYGSSFLFAIIYILIIGIVNGFDAVDQVNFNSPGLNLFFGALGALACYGIHKYLENRGEKLNELIKREGIESIGVTVDEN